MPTQIKPFCVKWEDSEEFRNYIKTFNSTFKISWDGSHRNGYYGYKNGMPQCLMSPYTNVLTPSEAIARLKGEDETEKLKGLLRECSDAIEDYESELCSSDFIKDRNHAAQLHELLTKIKEAIK